MRLSLSQIGKVLPAENKQAVENKVHKTQLEDELRSKRAKVELGGGQKYIDRVHAKGKKCGNHSSQSPSSRRLQDLE